MNRRSSHFFVCFFQQKGEVAEPPLLSSSFQDVLARSLLVSATTTSIGLVNDEA